MTQKNISITRSFDAGIYLRIKSSFEVLLKKSGGAQDAAAFTRVGMSALYQMASQNEISHFPPADVIADLEKKAGEPVLTRALAELAGYSLIPNKPAVLHGSLAGVLAKVGKEVSDVFSDYALALEDGRMTPNEARVVITSVEEAISAFEALRNSLRDVIERSPSAFQDLMKVA